ncbi:MAG: AsnC family transcriptional regulator [Methanomassiliicoccales archaeon]
MDEVDVALSRMLLRNSRTPYSELGKELGLSPQMVHRRVQHLMDVEIIRGTYAALSFKAMKAMWVIVHGWSKANSMDEVAKDLRDDKHVAIMQVASGNYVYVHGNVTDAVGLAELVTSVQRSAKLSEPQVGIVQTAPLGNDTLSGMDLRIIKALANDTRRPVNEIAEELGTTAKTVRRRLDRLMKEDLVQLSINWQPDTMGDMVSQIHLILREGVPNEKAAYLMIKKYAPGIIRSYTFSNVPGFIILTCCNRNAREMQDTCRELEGEGVFTSVVPNVIRAIYHYPEHREAVLQDLLRRTGKS